MLHVLRVIASALLLKIFDCAILRDQRLHLNGSGNAANATVAANVNVAETPKRFRVIVLNLNSRPRRLQRFAQNLYNHPELFARTCRLPAVDASDKAVLDAIFAKGFASRDSTLNPGMLGCYMSHWTALQMIAADETIDFGVVMEDDLIHYSPDFDTEFSYLWSQNADAIWQRTDWVYLQMDGSGWFKGQNRSADKTQIMDMQGLWPKNTAMYAVSRTGAAQLAGIMGSPSVGTMMPIRLELDEALPTLLARKWAFVPPIAQALHKDEPGGDTNVQFLQKQVPVLGDCANPMAR